MTANGSRRTPKGKQRMGKKHGQNRLLQVWVIALRIGLAISTVTGLAIALANANVVDGLETAFAGYIFTISIVKIVKNAYERQPPKK